MHPGHKVIEIDDEESLKKENLTIEPVREEFNLLTEKTKELKNKIEKEIEKINNLYENVNNEVTKYFKDKHEILIKEENELKEKLNNEVSRVKEKLEIFLSESNKQINIGDRINKGIKSLNNEKNNIKLLTYISKINKSEKEMKNLFQELMRNIKISFEKEKKIINYEEYYFNGIPSPKDIQFKDIDLNSVNISWKIDNIKINNIDNKEIKYKVEMKKENKNKKFIKVYEGNNNNCKIENLKRDTNYEFRLCSFYNDLIGSWTKLYKIKTFDEINCDSNILKESNRENEFLKVIYNWCKFKKLELIYRATRDGGDNINFHKKCDNQGPNIMLFRNDKGNIFGGYVSVSWTNSGNYQLAPGSFLFTLTNIHNTQPTKFQLNNNNKHQIYFNSDYGPVFGNSDLYFYGSFLNQNNSNCYSYFPKAFEDNLGKGKSIFTGDFNNNNEYIKMNEIEIFKIL